MEEELEEFSDEHYGTDGDEWNESEDEQRREDTIATVGNEDENEESGVGLANESLKRPSTSQDVGFIFDMYILYYPASIPQTVKFNVTHLLVQSLSCQSFRQHNVI